MTIIKKHKIKLKHILLLNFKKNFKNLTEYLI